MALDCTICSKRITSDSNEFFYDSWSNFSFRMSQSPYNLLNLVNTVSTLCSNTSMPYCNLFISATISSLTRSNCFNRLLLSSSNDFCSLAAVSGITFLMMLSNFFSVVFRSSNTVISMFSFTLSISFLACLAAYCSVK